MWQGTEGSLTNSQEETEALWPTALKDQHPDYNQVSKLEGRPFPSRALT